MSHHSPNLCIHILCHMHNSIFVLRIRGCSISPGILNHWVYYIKPECGKYRVHKWSFRKLIFLIVRKVYKKIINHLNEWPDFVNWQFFISWDCYLLYCFFLDNLRGVEIFSYLFLTCKDLTQVMYWTLFKRR